MASKSVKFTSNGTWTSPPGVSAVFWTSCGGGGGTPGAGFLGTIGGGGSAELVCNKMIPIIPETEYAVIIGAGGLGTAYDTATLPGGSSQFAGLKVLGASAWVEDGTGSHLKGEEESGPGGGCGGSIGIHEGGGTYELGLLEARHYSGGCMGNTAGGSASTFVSWSLGGATAERALQNGSNHGGGGPGGGTIFGGNKGGDYNVGTGLAPTNPAYYGSGAGGPGLLAVDPQSEGANGSGGVVILTWFAL